MCICADPYLSILVRDPFTVFELFATLINYCRPAGPRVTGLIKGPILSIIDGMLSAFNHIVRLGVIYPNPASAVGTTIQVV